ncbi:DUF3298 and DUF4163 domain-containing protein [Sulfurovum sp. NBC37-1]|uniref:DUF3298 and DUF4163 domain-containing protein n=1 Tax=Sulfurovum sp. (strain NBC37-1) TaxID=387093 RepID=UPI0001587760|nr:DUF3298 and DUF4163 domain-containing protein [Sulfurovum sp. NBC37-1]BAF71613.1 hypothetical protein SUN_0654 [Sulfurovum sp. NBC37-1]
MNQILTLLLLTSLLSSTEIFLDKAWMQGKGIYTRSDSYCHPTKDESGTFCQKDELSYPVLHDVPDAEVAKQVENIVARAVTAYSKGDLKATVIKNLSDESYQPHGTWNTSNALDLFAVTKTTFTIANSGSGYTGGAHGYFSVKYENYDHEGKHLEMDDLLKEDYNATLHQIAQKVYKESIGLKQNDSLLKDGWFSNKFILSTNFAITERGLLFHYNAYEIKPYAAGHTKFMLPYSSIRSLIDPQGPLKTYLQIPEKIQSTYINEDVASLHISVKRIDPEHIEVDIEEKVWSYASRGWLSLSFPDLQKKNDVKIVASQGFKSIKRYPAGSKVYNQKRRKAVRSSYLLVEGEPLLKDNSKAKKITLLVTVPSKSRSLRIRVRISFKNGKNLITMPSKWDGVQGQQGFTNYELTFPLQ